jgi:hypothetical protein
MRRRWQVAIMVALSGLAAAGCATMRVASHVERGLDFSRYRTFDWGPADALPADDPRLAANPYFKDALEGAVEKQMAARGFAHGSAASTADLSIHYHASIDRQLRVNDAAAFQASCASDECRAGVERFDAGTIVIDIIDSRRGLLIWRGWTRGGVDGVLDNRERLAESVTAAIERLFQQLPSSGPLGGVQ